MRDKKEFKDARETVSDKMNIGEQIAAYRHKAKMSQAELAKKADTSRTAIARYESENYDKYNIATLKRIARALNKKLVIAFT